jgi:hypothetical protein
MDFKLTTRFSDLSRKLRKDWLSVCKKYRITWRRQYAGIELPPRYFALRLNKRSCDGRIFWDFALDTERRPYKTFKKAYQACCKAAGLQITDEVKKRKRQVTAPNLQVKRGRGRPKGSKNKVKNAS